MLELKGIIKMRLVHIIALLGLLLFFGGFAIVIVTLIYCQFHSSCFSLVVIMAVSFCLCGSLLIGLSFMILFVHRHITPNKDENIKIDKILKEQENFAFFVSMLVSKQVDLAWTAKFFQINLQSLVGDLRAWDKHTSEVHFVEKGTAVSLDESSLSAFSQLLVVVPKNIAEKFLGLLRRAFTGGTLFSIKEISEFLCVGVDNSYFIAQQNPQVRINGQDVEILPK